MSRISYLALAAVAFALLGLRRGSRHAPRPPRPRPAASDRLVLAALS